MIGFLLFALFLLQTYACQKILTRQKYTLLKYMIKVRLVFSYYIHACLHACIHASLSDSGSDYAFASKSTSYHNLIGLVLWSIVNAYICV